MYVHMSPSPLGYASIKNESPTVLIITIHNIATMYNVLTVRHLAKYKN